MRGGVRLTLPLLLGATLASACSAATSQDAGTVSSQAATGTATSTATSNVGGTPVEVISDSGSATAGPTGSPSPTPTPSVAPPRKAQLPLGGRFLFPDYRVVAYYGNSETPRLGVLGEGPPEKIARRVYDAAKPFGPAGGRHIQPAFEFIASVAQRSPGDDGMYSYLISDAQVSRYLAAARKARMLLILDLQPGRASFLDQARHFEKFLRLPDVGLALDPEWVLKPGQRPGRQIGTVTATQVNEVSAWLATLRARYDLPQKLFIVHQFQERMIRDRDQVVPRSGLATVFHIDGFGGQGIKRQVYRSLVPKDPRFAIGFKLFYDEDTNLMTPTQAMALRPQPDLVTYQ